MPLSRQIGRRIRDTREHRHLTQHALAAKVGCSYQLIQTYELGEKLSIDRVTVIADILEVQPEWLLAGIGAKDRKRGNGRA
jgi:transcriptional regulator with XRE-family HTH domain